MRFGIQTRLLAWLIVVILPITASCVVTVKLINASLTEQVQANLANEHRLEAARIEAALEQYLSHARGLSYSTKLRRLLDQVYAIRNNTRELALSDIDELDDDTTTKKSTLYSRTSQSAYAGVKDQLQQKLEEIQSNAEMTGSGVTELQLILPTGAIVAETTGFSWRPHDASISENANLTYKPIFGSAFLNLRGQARLPIVVPMFKHSASNTTPENNKPQLLGLLIVETKLEPVINLVKAHEGFGRIVESQIAHRNPNGDAEFITLMQFARGAAFKKVVSKDEDLPINWSLSSPERKVVRSPDYRGIDSILAIGTLHHVGWGLIVKMDADEAFGTVAKIKQVIWSAGFISGALILLSWLVLARPLVKRMETAAVAADRLAAGDYHILDLDRFKQIIDQNGHHVDDQKPRCSIEASATNPNRSLANCAQLANKKVCQTNLLQKPANVEPTNKSSLVRLAIAEKRAQIWYQPIVKSTAKRGWVIVGAEALLRLHDNAGKQIPPDKFIPDINNLDISTELDAYALSCVCDDYRNWCAANLINSDFRCSVNLCSHTVQTTRFPDLLQALLSKHQISPSSLLMEFSEESEKINIDMVEAIRALGVGISVDDFGVDNANLDRLAQIAPNVVKIDRTSISEIDSISEAANIQDLNKRKSDILANIISTCSELNISCVVEGLERQSQIPPLRHMGANKFQGFLFDAALPGEQFIQRLQNKEISQWSNASLVKLKRAS